MKKISSLILIIALCGSTWAQSTWTKYEGPVLEKGAAGSWDAKVIALPNILFNDNVYHMWYMGIGADDILAIGHATSPDGISWTKDPDNPVLKKGSSGSWDDLGVYHPKVIYEGSIFHMWYTGISTGKERGGYATSPDGVTWTKYAGNPVLSSGATGEWDAGGYILTGPVIYLDNKFHMWYGASNSFTSELGYATSTDGTSWTRHPDNPVLSNGGSGNWDYPSTDPGSVIFNGSTYEMWYCGGEKFKWRIGHATSPDGIQWTRDAGNPVLDWGSAGSWDDELVAFPSVLYDPASSKLKMWYVGKDSNVRAIGYAEKWITGRDSHFYEENDLIVSANPSNSKVFIHFTTEGTSPVKLSIFNLLGQEEVVLLDETRMPGEQEVSYDVSSLKSGMYLLRLSAIRISSAKLLVQ